MKKSLLATVVLSAILAACSSTPTTTATPAKDATAGKAAGGSTSADVKNDKITTAKPDTKKEANPWAVLTDSNNILSQRSVYFDYDKYEIKFMPLVEAHANFVKANAKAKVRVQGNTDERGSREYNLALGQKRANAVKQAMFMYGVPEERVEAVSLGEEMPRRAGKDEESYAENRRADILYNGEY
ncbi:MAG: peptidoglycan-associated lipoprotein Pal [Uliginosibacterium sp.]|jgi:peptidoglycan-associated lipoprotein|nr:peptidoglycan-associated lipoprotein Pal [Uliginosibacterium sp.]MBK9615068.1 peptidoglycan-associated lipoprotein Pal [Uliginosibacterium sp.]